MEAKDLRIGNYLLPAEEEFSNSPAFRIDVGDIKIIRSGSNQHQYKPVPLTEEWLIKFGFEIKQTGSNNEHWQYVECKLKPQFTIGNRKGYWSFTPIWNQDYQPINYVHQLQNLYFALTGTELEIK